MKKVLGFVLIFLILVMPLASAFSLNNFKSSNLFNKVPSIFDLKKEPVIIKPVVEPKLDYIPNDVVSWKDDPFLEEYDLSEYDSYRDFVIAQKSDSDRPFVQGGIADDWDTSLYMIGNVSISVILPESIGGSEDWTPEEIAQVKSEVESGINWWAAQEPNAHLNFIFNYEEQVPIADEAIEQDGIDWWLLHTMSELGYGYELYGGTQYWRYGVYDYLNNQRNLKNTDWGFVVFVADSSNDVDGFFANGDFAFTAMDASGGGPFLVMTYDNAGWGINNMDSISAHETGHIFGAGDQYASSGCRCTSKYGYLYYENQNCANSCLIDEPSIMKSNYPSVFANNQIDYYARGQIGWGDENSNGILDIIDFEPQINKYFSGFVGENFKINGTTYTSGMNTLNPYYADLIINKIGDVEYSINDEGWNYGFALDGLFDELMEDFGVVFEISDWGNYVFKLRARDRFGLFTSEENYSEINYENMGCTDSDVENNLYVSGLVENYNGAFGHAADECVENLLRQYSCDGNNIVYENYSCAYGCNNGACLDGPLTELNLPQSLSEQCSAINGIVNLGSCSLGYQDSNLFYVETEVLYKEISAVTIKNAESADFFEILNPSYICCVADTTAPQVSLVNPSSDEVISKNYLLKAFAGDLDSRIKSVYFEYFDGNDWILIGQGEFVKVDTYTLIWDTTDSEISLVRGFVDIRARAVDDALNEATSIVVENVFFNNTLP